MFDLNNKNPNSILFKKAQSIYKNPYEDRFNISSDLKNKTFIYCWYNIVTDDFILVVQIQVKEDLKLVCRETDGVIQ